MTNDTMEGRFDRRYFNPSIPSPNELKSFTRSECDRVRKETLDEVASHLSYGSTVPFQFDEAWEYLKETMGITSINDREV